MAFELIELGTTANDGTGDSARVAGEKINAIIAYLNGNSAERYDSTNSSKTVTENSTIFVDTSSNQVTITLPSVTAATDPVGYFVEIIDVAGTFATNKCIIDVSDGSLVQRVAAPLDLTVDDTAVRYYYTGATYGWIAA